MPRKVLKKSTKRGSWEDLPDRKAKNIYQKDKKKKQRRLPRREAGNIYVVEKQKNIYQKDKQRKFTRKKTEKIAKKIAKKITKKGNRDDLPGTIYQEDLQGKRGVV